MKIKRLIGVILAMVLIMLCIAGCASKRNIVQHERPDKSDKSAKAVESLDDEQTEDETEESEIRPEERISDVSDEELPSDPEVVGSGTTEEATEEMTPDQRYEADYKYYDEYFNSEPFNPMPFAGEFYSEDPNAEDAFLYKEDPNGSVYGFECDLTDGCSVWCSVGDYKSSVTASSFLAPIGNNTYNPDNAADRCRNTAWVEGVSGDGIGEKITYRRTYSRGGDVSSDSVSTQYDSFFFTNLCIVNGLAKNDDVWTKNGRVRSMNMYFNDEYVCSFDLFDTPKPQYISLSGLHLSAKSGEESSFTFEIADVYKGTKYDDTAITGIEIEMYTQNH